MKRAVLYARVSGDDRGREGRNLAGQLEMGREYARQKGYSVSAEITEDDRGASGASFELPGLSQVLAMAQAGDFDVLIPREIDRLSRNLAKQLVVEEELKRAGVEIDYVLGEYPDTPEGRLNKHIRATIAEYEREKIVERMTRGRRRKVEAGNVLVANHPPYGYKVVEADGKLTLVIDEQDARVVRMIFTWYVYGDGESEPMSLAAIAQKLTGIPTYADKYDHNRIKKRGWGKWGAPSVAQILKNQTYAGLWHYGKRNNLNGRWSLNADENLLPVKVPAIVSHELWAAAQARFAENKQNARRNTKYEYLMSKRVTCGACGYKMYGCGQKGIRGEKHYLNLYYRCHGTKSGQRAHICNIPSFRADQVDAVVWEWVRSLLLNPAALAQGLSEYQEEWGRKNAPFRERLRVVGDLITENQMQLKRLLDLYLSGEFPKEALIDTKTRLETTIIALEKERAELVGHLEEKSLTADEVQGLKEFAAAVGQGLDMMKEDFEMRRRIIETLDAQATLVIEGGQKIIYARCILSSDVCTLRPVAQVDL